MVVEVKWDHDCTYIKGRGVLHATAVRDYLCDCGSPLIWRWFEEEPNWRTVCVANSDHSPDRFRTKAAQEHIDHQMWIYQEAYNRRMPMGFVKDRHDEDGKVTGAHRVRRAGRISLGRQLEGGGAVAELFFTFKVYEADDMLGEQVLSQVSEELNRVAPGQEPGQPTVLPVCLPAGEIPLVASSTYKLPGKGGRARCVGDGETIQFRLGERNALEIYNGRVVPKSLNVDGTVIEKGGTVMCPGHSQEGRWSHCEKCRLSFTLDLHIGELPYIFSLTTGDQNFYNQFFTVLEIMEGHVRDGDVRSISDIPLILRREEGKVSRPTEKNGTVQLIEQDMPLLSIQRHPVWVRQIKASRTLALGPATEEMLQIDEGADDDSLFEKGDGAPLPPDALAVEVPSGYKKGMTLRDLFEDDPDYLIRIASEAADTDLKQCAQEVIDWFAGE